MKVVVKARQKATSTALSQDIPKGLKQCWLEGWALLGAPEKKLPLAIEGNVSGDPHLKAGSSIQVYNLRRANLVLGWVSTDTRVYLLGTRKE